ncbi:MAG TPA: beta-ketoacyl synthase chain length factor [Usitatibacter sp.]|nr:beta-ketoacyl synthase chain length factor [Usitatibacter sp.]
MRAAARIQGVGLVGPGLASWEAARAALAGSAPYAPSPTVLPMPDALPATERRRAGKCVRLALATGLAAAAHAGREPRDFATIFTSSTGDGDTLHSICEALASDDRLISPTRFHNSVHNAPAGYWGIATGAMRAADSIAAYDASFAAGLLEAIARIAAAPCPLLLVAYDAPYPEPLHAKRPLPDSFSVALAMARDATGAAGSRVTLETTTDAPTRMDDAALEHLRAHVPAARALPLLQLLARGTPGRVVLEYLDGLSIAVEATG